MAAGAEGHVGIASFSTDTVKCSGCNRIHLCMDGDFVLLFPIHQPLEVVADVLWETVVPGAYDSPVSYQDTTNFGGRIDAPAGYFLS